MAFLTKRGSFVANTGTGDQVIAGVGFQGKAVIFTGVLRLTTGEAAGDARDFFGCATGPGATEQWCIESYRQHNVASTNTGRRDEDNCLAFNSISSTQEAIASLVSFNADGFTINWSDAPAAAYLIEYLVLGGSSLNAKAFTYTKVINDPVGTDRAVTGVGFQPKAIFHSGGRSAVFPTSLSTDTAFPLGVVVSAAKQVWLSWDETDNLAAAAPTTISRQSMVGQNAGTTMDWEHSLLSFDSDGFTYNVDNASADGSIIFALALGGDDLVVDLNTHAQRTTVGETDQALSFIPSALFGFGMCEHTTWTISSALDGGMAIGIADANSEASIWSRSVDAADPTNVSIGHSQTKFLRYLSSAPAVVAECDVVLDGSGYTLDWTTVDATARAFHVLALGDAGAPSVSGTKLAMVI